MTRKKEKAERVAMGKRLAAAMEAKGETPISLAEKLGVTRVAVVQWMRGDNGARLRHVVKAASLLDVSVDFLVGAA